MKHIGIVNITTVGACLCANEIVAEAARQDASGKHPQFTMHAFSYHEYQDLVIRKDWDNVGKRICESVRLLKMVGADFAIIPSNTPHYAFKQIEQNSQLKVVNLIEVVANECQAKRYSKVLVLGTKMTMQDGLYTEVLQSRGITPVIPEGPVCDKIQSLIRDELIPSKINPNSVESVRRDIQKYECDAVILGCTELPVVYNDENIGKPVIDTTRLLAHHALKLAKLDA